MVLRDAPRGSLDGGDAKDVKRVKVGVNGFGRIGRLAFRAAWGACPIRPGRRCCGKVKERGESEPTDAPQHHNGVVLEAREGGTIEHHPMACGPSRRGMYTVRRCTVVRGAY